MSDAITAAEFAASQGTDGWEVVGDGDAVHTSFETGDFATGLRLVQRIGELAEEANHHPDVHLRYPSVGVRLSSHDTGGLSRRDAALAGQISAAAEDILTPRG